MIAIIIYIMFSTIVSLDPMESIFASFLWLFTAYSIALFLCKINRFTIIESFYGADDYLYFVLKISLIQMTFMILFGFIVSPITERFRRR